MMMILGIANPPNHKQNNQMQQANIVLLAGAAGGAVSAIISGLFTIWNNWLARRSEDRRALREIAMNMALENWKARIDWGKGVLDREKMPVKINPLEVDIIHMLKIAEMVSDRRITAQNVGIELGKVTAITKAATKAIDDNEKNNLIGRNLGK